MPAAVFGAEIVGEVVHRDQLVGVDLRVGAEADDDVRAGAGVGGDGGLRAHVLPAHEIDADRDAGLVGEFLGVFAEQDLVGIDKLGGAKDAEGGAGFGLEPGAATSAVGTSRSAARAASSGIVVAPSSAVAPDRRVSRRVRPAIRFPLLSSGTILGRFHRVLFGAARCWPIRSAWPGRSQAVWILRAFARPRMIRLRKGRGGGIGRYRPSRR